MNLYACKRGFWVERKRPDICVQSSLWHVMRITVPLFSSRGERKPGWGAEAQVSLHMCLKANGKH